jgi:redox-sensitive bicupin YhaK (pirin superfamily)
MIPRVEETSGTVAVISGTYRQAEGATQGDYVKVLLLDVALKPDATWNLPTDPQSTLFVYIVDGEGSFGEAKTSVKSRRAVLFHEGDDLTVQAGQAGMRFILFSGRPLREPIAWGGPIVMNTQEELDQAFAEIDNHTFIRE